jgi:hypothetical protein
VAYESLACGTPAIVARVATHRSLLPDDLIAKVHYDDNATAAAIAATIRREGTRTSAATMAYLHEHFAIEQQLNAYANAILNAQKVPPAPTRVTPLGAATRYVLAPWCYTWGDGMLFHDFAARHTHEPLLSALLAAQPDGFTPAQAAAAGADTALVDSWYRAGYVVPMKKEK